MILPRTALEKIHRHALEAWPEECCGFLIGRENAERTILEARSTRNLHAEHREVRYTIDPRETLRLDRELRGTDRAHLGFYHSHPNHPPRPSAFDLEHAWRFYTYAILSVVDRAPRELLAWRLDEERKAFKEEPVRLV